MNTHFVRKIMIDSRFRKSGTPSDFTFELNRAITLPSKCAGFITDIELMHSWYNVDDHNKFFYFAEYYHFHDEQLGPVLNARVHKIELDEKNYDAQTLAQDLQTRINNELVNGQQTVTVTYDANSGKITFGRQSIPGSWANIQGNWKEHKETGGEHEEERPTSFLRRLRRLSSLKN